MRHESRPRISRTRRRAAARLLILCVGCVLTLAPVAVRGQPAPTPESAAESSAAREMSVGRYRQERMDFTGAIVRFKVVVTQYRRTEKVDEALERLAECYMAIGIVDEARTAAAVLRRNFPDSRWVKDADSLLVSRGFASEENPGSWISKAFR